MDFSIDESPAVDVLGPLFKITEVHLWDEGSSEVRESDYFREPVKLVDGNIDNEKINLERFNGFSLIPEDVELAKELNDFGLPLSFHTNKETRYGMTSGKRKSTKNKKQQSHIKMDGCKADSNKVTEVENSLIDTSKMLDQSEILKNCYFSEIVDGIDGISNLSLVRRDSVNSTACTTNEEQSDGEISSIELGRSPPCANLRIDRVNSEGSCLINEVLDCDWKENNRELDTLLLINHENDGQSNDILENIKDLNVVAYSQFSEQANSNISGEWVAYWDDFFRRTYFYNVETGESTWDPPSGMEHLVCENIGDEETNLVDGLYEQMNFRKLDEIEGYGDIQPHGYLDQESRHDSLPLSQHFDGITGIELSAENVSSTNTTKMNKKVKRTKSNRKLSASSEDVQGVVEELSSVISKYWCQRYLLFSRFSYGIKMDEEGWFSVTPEMLAKHHAVRCGNGAIVDFFTGVGGNAIQFARRSKHVIAIDIDPSKIDYARHNAAIYGVDDNIDFIKGDSFSLAPTLKANTVFMSPPWGGPNYSKVKKFDINTMLKPRDGQFLFDTGKRIAPKIVMYLPRNVDVNQLAELSLSATPPWSLEVEMNYFNGRLKAVTAYFCETSV